MKRLKQENLLGVMFRAWCTDRRGIDIILDPFEMTHPEIAGASLLKNKNVM